MERRGTAAAVCSKQGTQTREPAGRTPQQRSPRPALVSKRVTRPAARLDTLKSELCALSVSRSARSLFLCLTTARRGPKCLLRVAWLRISIPKPSL